MRGKFSQKMVCFVPRERLLPSSGSGIEFGGPETNVQMSKTWLAIVSTYQSIRKSFLEISCVNGHDRTRK